MQLHLEVNKSDVERIRRFYNQWSSTPMVVARAKRNVEGKRERLTEHTLWRAIVTCQLTTQQRSGPDAPITKFMRIDPFPLSLEVARRQREVERWAAGRLSAHGGIRRYNQLASELAGNLECLDAGAFGELLAVLRPLEQHGSKESERSAAHQLDETLSGVGPKQARNILQSLGISQFEIPLDSRVAKWLGRSGFPLPIAAVALSDGNYYDFVLDRFQELAEVVGILPCLLDAAIFASFDKEWKEKEVVW